MTNLKYPIGKFEPQAELNQSQRDKLILSLAETPAGLRLAVGGLSAEQLDTPYRPDGWTLRQTVNHVAESHLNGYTRFKFALTEAEPMIRPYDEKLWAELADGRNTDPEVSLALLEALHQRWVTMLRSLNAEQFARTTRHPEHEDWGAFSLDVMLGLYEWHGRHHTAHITCLRQRMNW
ncbi:MAG TPA: bacillithiol transferase BstA [Blastocatellia bacterium]|nr:bacillithiol transferase BstA [Blastocatellia bacterium]